MADKVGSAYLTVEPKLSKDFSSKVAAGGESAGASYGGKFSAAAQGAMGVGIVALGNLLSQVAEAAAKALEQFIADTIQNGAAFEASMSQVAATMGVSVGEIQDLTDYAKEMGSTTAFSATQAAEALNYMALAGYTSEQSMSMLPNVLNLAAAGSIDLARASDMVTDAQSALGLSFEQTNAMVDQMAKAASKSNTSVEQLGDAFLTVGATARSMAGGTQEMATILGVLADNGIKGSEGGTHLRNILLSLQAAAVDGVATFGDYSVAIYDADGNMRNTIDIIADLQAGLGDMDQASRDAILSGVFNKTDLSSINALLGTSTGRFQELSEAIGDSAGAAQQMANTQLDNLSGDMTMFQSALEGVQIAIFEGVSPVLREFVQLGTEGLGALKDLIVNSPLPDILGKIGAAFASVGERIGSAFMPVFEKMSAAVGKAMPYIEAAVTTAMNAIGFIVENVWTLVSDQIVGAAENIAAVIDFVWPYIEQVVTDASNAINAVIQAVWPVVSNIITNASNAVRNVINAVWPAVKNIVTNAMNGIRSVVQAVWPVVQNIVTGAVNAIKGAINGISSVVGGVRSTFRRKCYRLYRRWR